MNGLDRDEQTDSPLVRARVVVHISQNAIENLLTEISKVIDVSLLGN